MSRYARHQGFTLVEILIVFGLIAMLLGLGINTYSGHMTRARDTKRKADINTIQKALEQHYVACNATYPPADSGFVPDVITCVPTGSTLLETPRAPGDTRYTMTGDSTQYTICTDLEQEPIPFCLTNKQ